MNRGIADASRRSGERHRSRRDSDDRRRRDRRRDRSPCPRVTSPPFACPGHWLGSWTARETRDRRQNNSMIPIEIEGTDFRFKPIRSAVTPSVYSFTIQEALQSPSLRDPAAAHGTPKSLSWIVYSSLRALLSTQTPCGDAFRDLQPVPRYLFQPSPDTEAADRSSPSIRLTSPHPRILSTQDYSKLSSPIQLHDRSRQVLDVPGSCSRDGSAGGKGFVSSFERRGGERVDIREDSRHPRKLAQDAPPFPSPIVRDADAGGRGCPELRALGAGWLAGNLLGVWTSNMCKVSVGCTRPAWRPTD